MNMRRKLATAVALVFSIGAISAGTDTAVALDYPTKPVRILVGLNAGALPDILARIMGQALSERLGQPFVIENRPGAATNVATEAVVRSPPDGYTLLLVNPPNAISASVYDNLRFNFIRDIAPVASFYQTRLVMVVHPSVPAATVPEFIAYAKANPGKLNFASNGKGGVLHLSGELFKMMAGVDMVHVPYRGGGNVLTDLITGHVQVSFIAPDVALEHVKADKLRLLAVTSAGRWEAEPNVPTVAEFLPGYEALAWFGIGAPKDTPQEIVDRLNREINAILADPRMRARFAELGGSTFAGSPADFGKFIADETDKMAKIVRFAGVKGE